MLKTQETKLITFLQSIDKKHIDELIDILTDFGNGRIALNSTVKQVLLSEKNSNSKQYAKELIELILTEFQKYAGDSFYNLFRKELVTYSEVLNDVYDAIMNESSIISTRLSKMFMPLYGENEILEQQKEKRILSVVLGDNLEYLSFSDRYNLSTKITDILTANSTPARGLIKKLSLVARASSFSQEAYRIMIPFIVQISWLKHNYTFYSPNNSVSKEDDISYTISKYKFDIERESSGVLDEQSISNLNQLLGHIPDLLIKGEAMNGNYAMLDVSLDKLAKVKDGNGLRGIVHARNAKGKFGIAKNVKIDKPEKLSKLLNSGLLVNLASTLVAQKHLADINQNLLDIKERITDIKNFLQNDRVSKIKSALNEAEQVYYEIKKIGSIPESTKQRLNMNIKDLMQVIEHLKIDIQEGTKKAQRIKFDSFLNRNNSYDLKNLSQILSDWKKHHSDLDLGSKALLSIYALFWLFEHEYREYYLDRMNQFVSELSDFISVEMMTLDSLFEQILLNGKSFTNFESTDLANLAFIKNRKLNLQKDNILFLDNIKEFKQSYKELPNVELIVSINDAGKIETAKILNS